MRNIFPALSNRVIVLAYKDNPPLSVLSFGKLFKDVCDFENCIIRSSWYDNMQKKNTQKKKNAINFGVWLLLLLLLFNSLLSKKINPNVIINSIGICISFRFLLVFSVFLFLLLKLHGFIIFQLYFSYLIYNSNS